MNERHLNLGYVPALDGIRALAIIFVMLFHVGLALFKNGGFLGVDVFFCLSGYLITLGLLKEYRSFHKLDFKNFYIRRFLRLLPALLLLLLALNIYGLFAYEPDQFQHNLQSSLISMFYISNLVKAFIPNTVLSPLAHTWSLSMEEQFYVLWPLTLLILFRIRLSGFRMLFVVVMMTVVSWLLGCLLLASNVDWTRIYFGPDTRFYQLLIGCALAIYVDICQQDTRLRLIKIRGWHAVLAFMALIIMVCIAEDETALSYYLFMPATVLATATLILHIISPEPSLIKQIFEFRWLVLLGRISYGLYLYHLVILILFLHGLNQRFFIGIPISIAVSLVSFFFYEQPILKLKSRFQPRPRVDMLPQANEAA